MSCSFTKIMWIIKLRRIYESAQAHQLGVDQLIELIHEEGRQDVQHQQQDRKSEPQFSIQEMVDSIKATNREQLSIDEVFQLAFQLKENKSGLEHDNSFQKEGAAHTWTNCSLNTSQISQTPEETPKGELFININIYNKLDKRLPTLVENQKKRHYHHSRQPSAAKKEDMQQTRKTIIQINSLHNEILKKTRQQKKERKTKYYSVERLSHNRNFLSLSQPRQLLALNDPVHVLKLTDTDRTIMEGLLKQPHMAYLQMLCIQASGLQKLPSLQAYMDLQVIKLDRNLLSDLNGIERAYKLQELYAPYNRVSDLCPFRALTQLRILDLSYNRVSHLQQLVYLSKSQRIFVISFQGNPIQQEATYKRILLKLLPGLRGIDIEEPSSQSEHPLKSFFERLVPDLSNFSFSQDV